VEQVRSIAVERVGAVLGQVPSGAMTQLDEALRLHLQL
jgi:mRNA interferase MazF